MFNSKGFTFYLRACFRICSFYNRSVFSVKRDLLCCWAVGNLKLSYVFQFQIWDNFPVFLYLRWEWSCILCFLMKVTIPGLKVQRARWITNSSWLYLLGKDPPHQPQPLIPFWWINLSSKIGFGGIWDGKKFHSFSQKWNLDVWHF